MMGFCRSSWSSGGAEVSLMLANLIAFAASWNISLRRWRACTAVSDILEFICVCRDCEILSAAAMIASAEVTDGFVVYFCLKNTVSDNLFALVEITHRSQQ